MIVTEESLGKLLAAGKIAASARSYAASLVKPGASLLVLAESVEAYIRKEGGSPAFPVNISLNSVAAHATPSKGETTVFSETDVVKVDVGVHVDGYIADTAVTVCLDTQYADLKKAAENALEQAIKIAKPGVNTSEIGAVIQSAIESKGFKPVSNLTGHGLDRYIVHDHPTIPNIAMKGHDVLEEGQLIAIEPFATDGAGAIREGSSCTIFSFAERKGVRLPAAKKILDMAEKQFSGLPFATRWIPGIDGALLQASLNQLLQLRAIEGYPVLKEVGEGVVAQAEHTVVVSGKPIVITQ